MKIVKVFYILLAMCFMLSESTAQGIVGKWKTIYDAFGKVQSVAEIYENDRLYYGRITDILNPDKKDVVCRAYKDELTGKPLLGMTIIKGLTMDEDIYENETILNPNNGNVYGCYLNFNENLSTFQVRDYITFFRGRYIGNG